MNKFVIITDSCSDLDKSLRTQFDIEYVPMHFSVDDNDYEASLDWASFSVTEFYNLLRNGKRILTAQVTVEEYKQAFKKHLDNGYDVLSISCSSALSASVKASFVAKEELEKDYPDRKIICVDSLNSCYGLGIMVITASRMRSEGKTIEEIAEWIENHKLEVNQECTPDKLLYLKRAGRVSATSAFFGGLLNIKPIIISDAKGQNFAVEKVKGRKVSIERLAERFLESYNPDAPYQCVCISHADSPADASLLKDAIIKKLGHNVDIYTGYIGPIVGASCGPGTLAVYFYGKKVTVNG